MKGWRYLATRLDGDGNEEVIDQELILADASITRKLSGPPTISGTIPIDFSQYRDSDGKPLFNEWGTGIYAEDPNGKLYGGILVDSSFNGPSWQLDCPGFSFYPKDQPYVDSRYWIDVDPLAMHRHIWEHLQGLQDGNIGMQVERVDSPVRIGTQIENVEFQTAEGQMVAFEAGPYKLNYFTTTDLGAEIDKLAKETPFDWEETSYWNGDAPAHLIRVGYPRLGRRRDDMQFTIGSNVRVIPGVERLGSDYASDVLYLGQGEGRDRVAGSVTSRTGRLRRVSVQNDKSIRSRRAAVEASQRELERRNGFSTVDSVVVNRHPHADIDSLEMGDEILLQGWTGRLELNHWVRVVEATMSPAKSEQFTLKVVQADGGSAT